MDAERGIIRNAVGLAPVECPWFSLARPDVQEIAHLHRAREHGMLAVGFGGEGNLPARLAAGILEYDLAQRQALEFFARRNAQNAGAGKGTATEAVRRLNLPPPVVNAPHLTRQGRG